MKSTVLILMFVSIFSLSFGQQKGPVNYDYLCQTWVLKKATVNGKSEEPKGNAEIIKFIFYRDSTFQFGNADSIETEKSIWELDKRNNRIKIISLEKTVLIKVTTLTQETLILKITAIEAQNDNDQIELTMVPEKK